MNGLLILKFDLKYKALNGNIHDRGDCQLYIEYIALGYVKRKYEFSNFWSPIY